MRLSAGFAAVALVAGAAVFAPVSSGCDDCSHIEQRIEVPDPDGDLKRLFDSCRTGADCGLLCDRLLAIAQPLPDRKLEVEECTRYDKNIVTVKYRACE